MQNTLDRRNIFIIIYYILLLALFLSWQNPNSVPGGASRIAYMIAVFAPVFIGNRRWLIAPVVIVFFTLAKFGYTSSYMPAMWYTYVFAIIAALCLSKGYGSFNMDKRKAILLLVSLFVLSSSIDIITSGKPSDSTPTLFVVILFVLAFNFGETLDYKALSYSFVVLSFTLSLQYLLMGVTFTDTVNTGGFEREGFKDINYSACIISLGVMVCLIHLFTVRFKENLKLSVLVCLTIVVSMLALAQNASRGSFFSIAAFFAFLIIFSNSKVGDKILIVSILALLLFLLYGNGYFDLLEYRLANDDRTGSRYYIWANKMSDFDRKSNVLTLLFGVGLQGGRDLGGGNSTHNDFLSFFLYYGIVGFLLFIAFMIFPFLKANRGNKGLVAAGTIGIAAISFTLEPFAKGMIPYYGFWLYLLVLGKIRKEQI